MNIASYKISPSSQTLLKDETLHELEKDFGNNTGSANAISTDIRLKKSLKVIDFHQLLSLELPPREMILEPWLATQGTAMIYAMRGIGKTFVSLNIAYAVASGGSFLGWQASKPRGVLFLDGEMPAHTLKERLIGICKSNEKQPIASLRIITPDLQEFGIPDLGMHEGQQAINELITSEIALIIVDNISTLVKSGKENEADSWRPLQEWALRLRAHGKTVLFIHHAGKSGDQRGTSKREDILETIISLKRPEGYSAEQGAAFVVNFEKSRGFYGEAAKAFIAQLKTDEKSHHHWITKSLEETTFDKVVGLLKEGIAQNEISQELAVNKSTVSRYAKKAAELGLYQSK